MKSFLTSIGLMVLLFFSTVSSWGQEIAYSHKIEVKNMVFQWQIDGDKLNIELSAPTTGWVGIGFNPSDGMKDANFILGYVKKGKAKVTDHYGTQLRQHKKDTKLGGKKDVTNAKGGEKDGVTTISFTIPIDSGDSKDQALAVDQDTVVLLAYGSGRDSFNARHKTHARLSVNLTTGAHAEK